MIRFDLKDEIKFDIVCDEIKRHIALYRKYKIVMLKHVPDRRFAFLSGAETRLKKVDGNKYVEIIGS